MPSGTSIQSQSAQVTRFLASLPPTGLGGFEGLVTACLAELTGRVFRLARSGFQFGHDGRSDPGGEPDVLVECKRYGATKVDLREIEGEISQAVRSFGSDLLWVLAATVAVDANAAASLRAAGDRSGIDTLVIDALPIHMPRIVVLLAAARQAVEAWCGAHVGDVPSEALDLVAADPTFATAVADLRTTLSATDRSYAAAREVATSYYDRLFADLRLARKALGQGTAPRDPSVRHVPRPRAMWELDAAVRAGKAVVVLGAEGVGKSWLVADWWLAHSPGSAFVFVPAKEAVEFVGRDGQGEALLASAVARARGLKGAEAEAVARHVARWMARPPAVGPVVVVDGLNERQVNWGALLVDLEYTVRALNGRLILTCRPEHYRRENLRSLDFAKTELALDGYDRDELASALRMHGRDLYAIPARVRPGLANPRVFGVAIEMLDALGAGELSPDRILFNYWRIRHGERGHRHTEADFHRLLVSHAKAVRLARDGTGAVPAFDIDAWKDHSSLARRVDNRTLDHDLDDIAEGRFMRPIRHATRDAYGFDPATLPFALGMRLVFEVLDALSGSPGTTATDQLAAAIEPIAGFDRAFEVLQGALAVACLHRPHPDDAEIMRRTRELTVAIIDAMMGMQNRSYDLRDEFVAFVRDDPHAYLDVAEAQTGEGQNRMDEWLLGALRFGRRTGTSPRHAAAAAAIDERVERWVAWIPPDFEFEGASSFEQEILQRFASESFEVRRQPSVAGCQVLAGTALAPFTPSFLAGLVASGAATGHPSPGHVAWLLLLNQVDPETVVSALTGLAGELATCSLSGIGREALATLLRCPGRRELEELARRFAGRAEDRDPRDQGDPDIPPEPNAAAEGVVDDLAGIVAAALADSDAGTMDHVATLFPSFPRLFSRDVRSELARFVGAQRPEVVDLTRRALGGPATFDTTRIAAALGYRTGRGETAAGSHADRLEPFALVQSLLAATDDHDMPSLLSLIDWPADSAGWPPTAEDCAIPSSDSVETLLSDPAFSDDGRTAGLLRLLRRGPPFPPGPRLRDALARCGGRARAPQDPDDVDDAALDLAAHLPDDDALDLDLVAPNGRAPGRSFSEIDLFARASRRLGLDAVDGRLGPAGRCKAIAFVPDDQLAHLLDLLSTDLDRLANPGSGTIPAGGRKAERQVEALSAVAGRRLAASAPDRLVAIGELLRRPLAAGTLPPALQAFALSLLPALSDVAPSRAASLLGAVLDQRTRRSAGQDRARPLATSGLLNAMAMAEHPAVEEVLARLIRSSPDDAMLAQVVETAAETGRLGRIEQLVGRWSEADRPADVAFALSLAIGLPAMGSAAESRLAQEGRGFLGAVSAQLAQRLAHRRRAEEALAVMKPSDDVHGRLRIEAIAIAHVTPGAPVRGTPGEATPDPLDRLLRLRLIEAAGRRRDGEYGKTLFGLSAPPAWLTASSASSDTP